MSAVGAEASSGMPFRVHLHVAGEPAEGRILDGEVDGFELTGRELEQHGSPADLDLDRGAGRQAERRGHPGPDLVAHDASGEHIDGDEGHHEQHEHHTERDPRPQRATTLPPAVGGIRVRGTFGRLGGHRYIRSGADTPIRFRPLRSTCPVASLSQSRVRCTSSTGASPSGITRQLSYQRWYDPASCSR